MFEVEFSKAYNCAMELCTELGAKVEEYELTPNETERAYKVAREGFKRVWDDVNAYLREERVEGSEKSNANSEINMAIKGIKTNNKRMCSSSSRPKNALEKTRKRSKVSKRNLSTPEIDLTPENPTIKMSMTGLLLEVQSGYEVIDIEIKKEDGMKRVFEGNLRFGEDHLDCREITGILDDVGEFLIN
ncbi:hypothetical protein L6452_33041 [Arctium lappa]|uniref:Uncharacterized protein n=1 Tax=Arctium lappa TaxID=4217 RepID=A0ACB8Z7E3_ARCLA|nr:hypothetical protein L6452_33041 [Arctium lappa]